MNKIKLMKEIEYEVQNCKKCSLYKTRKNVVFGSGNINSKIFFIGEAPGKNEDEKGIPFCGRAGKILDNLLELISLKRENIYITNVLKCRPPYNRKPKKEEIEKCKIYLEKQIEIMRPKIICCLGMTPLNFIFKKFNIEEKAEITKIHGNIIERDKIKIIPLFHPAFAIYNPKSLKVMRSDFSKIKELI